jgi:hypothetical protein
MQTIVARFASQQELDEALGLLHQFQLDAPKGRRATPSTKKGVGEGVIQIAAIGSVTLLGGIIGLIWGLGLPGNIPATVAVTPASVGGAVALGLSVGMLGGMVMSGIATFIGGAPQSSSWVVTAVSEQEGALLAVQVRNNRRATEVIQILNQAHGTNIYLREGGISHGNEFIPTEEQRQDAAA